MKTYIEIAKELEKLDYKELIKAIVYFEKSCEMKEKYNFDEKKTDEILEKTYSFFMESDLGSFIDERLLNNVDKLIDEALAEDKSFQQEAHQFKRRK